ncbi:hypothetical protein GCM10011332_08910 [Terasakiella brassicae]|uniref:AlpA family transcriptional regulator n=2 Tax=Terasakiella brassicae TaxID=1634917 RepID=A0A917F950_9PROT|nr:hypothetical protein GCM10011332_08910 [Terasakiella brassicae]
MKKIMRTTDVLKIVQFSRSTLWRKVQSGEFPAPVELGSNSSGYFEHEVLEWLNSRPRKTISQK